MYDTKGTQHRINGVAFVNAALTKNPNSFDATNESAAITADMAYIRDDGLTCGKLSVHTSLCSEETLKLLAQLIESLEKDASSAVFLLDNNDTDEENVDPF